MNLYLKDSFLFFTIINMRSVTQKTVEAFKAFRNYKLSNSEVENFDDHVNFYLHWNTIATVNKKEKKLILSSAGWRTNTTKERLNGILAAFNLGFIYQKNFTRFYKNWSEVLNFKDCMEFSF